MKIFNARWAIGTCLTTLALPLAAAAQSTTLPEVVVSASRTPLPPEQVGSSITVLRRDELQRNKESFLSDSLRQVPGLALSRSGGVGTLTDLRIRGAENNHTVVFIDGIEVTDPSAGSQFDFSDVMVDNLEAVEILRGPQSALWGSDAIGGVVNIITRRGSGKPEVAAGIEGGSFTTRKGTARFAIGNERYDIAVSGIGFETNGVSAASEGNGNTEQDGYESRTGHLNAGVRVNDKLSFRAVGRILRSTTETDGFTGGVGAVDQGSETETKRRFGRIEGRYDAYGGDWEHIVSAGLSDEQRDFLTNGLQTSLYDGQKVKYGYQTNYHFATEGALPAEHTATLAVERKRERVVARSAFSNVNRVTIQDSAIGEYRIGLFDNLFLGGSLRRDDNDLFDDATTWRGTAAYLLKDSGIRFHASLGKGVKNPTIFELYGFTATFSGNPNLQPEEAIGGDIGVEQKFLDGRALADITFFRNEIENLISGSGTTAVNLSGTSKINGVEVSGRWRPYDPLSLSASYTYTDGEDSNGTELVRRPRHIASVNAAYDFTVSGAPANVNLGVDYHGRRNDLAFDAFFNTSTVTLGSYTLVNLAASWEPRDGVELYARLENALDEDYEDVLSYGAPGRSLFAGARLTF